MIYLLDANILIALVDSNHVHHIRSQTWFHSRSASDGWATCPLTENALLRILANPNYPTSPGDASIMRTFLDRICSWPGHQFWSDSVSLRDASKFPHLPGVKKLTDLYLLGLAVENGGCLATLDERINPSQVTGGSSSLVVIP